MSPTVDIDDLDVYSAEIEEMDDAVTILATMEILTGIFGFVLMLMNFAGGFFPEPLAFVIAFVANGLVIGALGILAIYAGWGLWQLKPWAWRTALAVNVASLIMYLLTFSVPFILLNAVLVAYLRTRRVRNIYADIQVV
ncbi:MAG: hypothetical protein ACW96M_06735 [Candidatus Thorarchaeota archaeon]